MGRKVGVVLGTMVCPSFVLGGDANTGPAVYVCLETELVDGESDFHAAMPAAFAFAAFLGLPSCFALVCPAVPAALPGFLRRFRVLAALMGWPSCFAVESPAVLAALSGVRVLAAMLFWAALSDGYGGYACCVEYSLEFLFRAATLIAPLAAENTRLFIFVRDGAGGFLC